MCINPGIIVSVSTLSIPIGKQPLYVLTLKLISNESNSSLFFFKFKYIQKKVPNFCEANIN